MSAQKRRKPLGDALGSEFVFGTPEPQETTPESHPVAPAKETQPKEGDILSRVLAPTEERERMIRFTADLPESLHRKLTMLAAKSGKKKVEIVRAILEEVLKDVNE